MRDHPYLVSLFVLALGLLTCSYFAEYARLCLRHFKRGEHSLAIKFGLRLVAIPVPITILVRIVLDRAGFAHSRIAGRTLTVLFICVLGFVPWYLLAACLRHYKRADHSSGVRILLGLAAAAMAVALYFIFVAVGFALFWVS